MLAVTTVIVSANLLAHNDKHAGSRVLSHMEAAGREDLLP